MADVINKLTDIEDFFVNLTFQMLGLNPTSQENQGKVRLDWQYEGAPAWKRTEDIVFLKINNANEDIQQTREIVYSPFDTNNLNRIAHYTRVHVVEWTLYGPNAYDNAELIRNALYEPDIIEQCANDNMFLILDVPVPIRAPELFNGMWWERVDFSVRFNENVIVTRQIPSISGASVKIYTEEGEVD